MTVEIQSYRYVKKRTLYWSAVFVFITAMFSPAVSPARPAQPPSPEKCSRILKQVLDQDDFGQKKTVYHWERIEKKKSDSWLARYLKGLKAILNRIRDAFKKWTGPMATVFEILMWGLLGGGGAWFIYRYTNIRRLFAGSGKQPGRDRKPAPILFGMAVTPESLPADIAGECRQLLKKGKHRQALALLYRGTLSRLLHVNRLPVPDCATENECDRLVTAHRPASEASFFRSLTARWLDIAYGHRQFEQKIIADLIDRWHELYDPRRSN